MQEDIEAAWFGEDQSVVAVSESVLGVAITNEITNGQTESISVTIAVAIGITALFFWLTLRQPMLAFIAVVPVVFVLICVLGVMSLLNIPYSLVTSIITALSIGIGVDYTIHMIHRYREEFGRAGVAGEGGGSDAGDHGLGAVGLGVDDGVGSGGAGVVAVDGVGAVWDYGGDHDWLLAAHLDFAGAAGDDGLGFVPEHAAALDGGANVG